MPFIQLSGKRGKGYKTLVDEDTFREYGHLSWYLSDTGYAMRRTKEGNLRLHRLVANTPEGLFTDHKNHDRLDNRASNLRVVTQKENMANYKGEKGYTWDASKNKWMVRYKGAFYGRYLTEQEAKNAYKLACSGVPYPTSRRKLWHLPTGISKQFGLYRVAVRQGGVKHWIGGFDTLEEAVEALERFKQGEPAESLRPRRRTRTSTAKAGLSFDTSKSKAGRRPYRVNWTDQNEKKRSRYFKTHEEGETFMKIANESIGGER
ncbi:HNH endonuclease [Paenarthrobacter sp. MSM-2-10-13]|uniref:HNH endonuclease signature motif containing protein n=1 Tax=Paenarthrobacter sp. MSM-2-10-13 TaxID=2717318 RepID=UPI00141E700A|nr:HNH endonuclease signature motif containing protein [Paenarthrobacter sp. MSM-2-10-13]NHW45929.1 HNH endonuclease [Paenarthrobacter sp. MSM-2-10-13]